MMKLYCGSASPYSAKVLMAAKAVGIALETVKTDTSVQPPELTSVNPLGRIPVLVTEEGLAVHDSRAITQFLNRQSGNRLFPRQAAKRTDAEILESLADGLCDYLLTHVYERRFRPEEKVHAPWLDRVWSKVVRTLDLLEKSPPKLTGRLHVGQIALRAALGYIELRFPDTFQQKRSRLKRWVKKFDQKYPELVPLLPR